MINEGGYMNKEMINNKGGKMTAEELQKEVGRICQMMGISPKDVKVEKFGTRYGLCSSKGVITFSNEILNDNFTKREDVIRNGLLHLMYFAHGVDYSRLWKNIYRKNKRGNDKCGINKMINNNLVDVSREW